MRIATNIIKHYLHNAYFITGTAYAGKSTMVKMLAEKYDMIFCGENYTSAISAAIADPAYQKDLCYITLKADKRDAFFSGIREAVVRHGGTITFNATYMLDLYRK